MPLIEILAATTLAAASFADAAGSEVFEKWRAVVEIKVTRGQRFLPGNVPVIMTPTSSITDESVVVLNLEVPAGESAFNLTKTVMVWFLKTYRPEWFEAMLKTRRERMPFWVRDQIIDANLSEEQGYECEEIFFDIERDWPENDLKILGFAKGGELALVNGDQEPRWRLTKPALTKMLLGQAKWHVLLRRLDSHRDRYVEEDEGPEIWFETVDAAKDANEARSIAMKAHFDREREFMEKPGRVIVEAVFFGVEGVARQQL